MMGRIWMVATRDFVATVLSRGFLVGILMMPMLVLLFSTLVPRILSSQSPQLHGEVVVIDRSGSTVAELQAALRPEAIAARRMIGAGQGQPAATPSPPPVLTVRDRGAQADLQQEKSWLMAAATDGLQRAVVEIPAQAVTPAGATYDTYRLYVSKGMSDATERALHEALRAALVASRLKLKGLDPQDLEATMRVRQPEAIVVAPAVEQTARRVLRRMLPFATGVLLFVAVLTGGQVLMTSTVEEKSSRVVEVLLAALSPLELMWGKLLAQLGVSLLTLAVYTGLGLLTLARFGGLGEISPMLVVDLLLFFIVTYLIFASMMLMIGGAVSQMADAQSLFGPVMLLMLVPYILSGIIGQAPSSAFSVTLSFVPPLNTFAMLARLASDAPPPAWQVALSLALGLVFASGVIWFAAKVFKISLLMHGKPPNYATLIRWARMA